MLSNKPKIFAHCPAGCNWETVHKSDFEKSATFVNIPITSNTMLLEFNTLYRVFKTNSQVWTSVPITFTYTRSVGGDYPSTQTYSFSLASYHFQDYLNFRLLKIELFKQNPTDPFNNQIDLTYELNGEVKPVVHINANLTENPNYELTYETNNLSVTNPSELLLYNDDAEILLEVSNTADNITYDNETSELDATNVQDAIDETLNISNKLAEEQDYTTSAIINAQNIGFDVLVVETLKDVTAIDQTLLDGADVVSNYWKSNKHAIIKTSNDTLSIESVLYVVDNIPYKAYINLDYTGTGSVNAWISKNNGTDWFALTPNTLTNLNGLSQKQIRVKLELAGVVTLKNLYWGIC